MKNKSLKKSISVLLSILMLLTAFACALPVSAAEDHECVWTLVQLVRPVETAGVWGNGQAMYSCTVGGTAHYDTRVVTRADYTAYDAIIAELNAMLAEPTLSAEARSDIEAVLKTSGVPSNLITSEQNDIDEAVFAIADAVGKYMAKYSVVFKDADGTVLSEQEITFGFDAVAPEIAFKEGYVFLGWDKEFTNVTADLVVTAQYFEGRGYLEVDTERLGLQPGAVAKVNASLVTDEDTDKSITWTVADTAVATVDANGLVVANGIGYTTLTVSALDGALTKVIDLYVYDGKEDYTITLVSNGMGNFVVNGDTTGFGFAKVKSGQAFRFQFALGNRYDPEKVIVTANGKEVALTADNYFEIPFVCENMTVTVSLRSDAGNTDPAPEQPEQPDPDAPVVDTCWCHSDNALFKFVWNLLMFFCRMLGVESYHYCACGAAHW